MVPAPTLTELIDTIRSEADTTDPLAQLATASGFVAELTEVGDYALGFFVDQCRRSGLSWSEISTALGVSKQAAHKRFNEADAAAELLTPRAQSALFAATGEAQSLRHNYVGTEHLLLGLFDPSRGLAARALKQAGITRAVVRQRVAEAIPPIVKSASSAKLPFTPRATQCLSTAAAESRSLGHSYIGTEHLLLAVAHDSEGLGSQLLHDLGLTYDAVRAAVITMLTNGDAT
jgi:hypothetical protein